MAFLHQHTSMDSNRNYSQIDAFLSIVNESKCLATFLAQIHIFEAYFVRF